jgi:hypothetical protein
MPIVNTLASDALGEALGSLVEQLIANEPFKAGGFDWAAQPQSYYCEKLNISPATLRRRIAKPPFVRAWKMVGAKSVAVGGDTTVIGGKKLCILRIGVAPPKDVADEAKRVMITIWNKVQEKHVTKREAQCLWGMTKDIMELLNALSLPTELAGELAIAMFKCALSDWQPVVSAIKLEMESRKATKGYKPRFYNYPCISVIRSFWKASLHAYVAAIQSGDVKKQQVPKGLAILTSHASWKVLKLTDPMIGHPGVTAEMEKTYTKLQPGQIAWHKAKAALANQYLSH